MNKKKKWKDVHVDHTFADGSRVVQRHQTHLYDCYKVVYEDDEGRVRSLVGSKDHLIKVCIDKLPIEAQAYINGYCSQGKIPLREDVTCEVLGYVDDEKRDLIYSYVRGGIDSSYFTSVEEISEGKFEVYLFTFLDGTYKEVFVKRETMAEESQKIDENHYWIPLEGISWLYQIFGPIEI